MARVRVILAAECTVIDAPQLFTSGEHFNANQFTVDRAGALVERDAAQLLDERASDADVERVSKSLNSLLLGIQNNDADQASLDDIETLLLRKALDRASGNVAAAARLLGITRPQMVYRLKSRGITHAGE